MRTLVIIPTYNEANNIREIIKAILSIDNNIDVLVVDDNSKDGTGDICENLSKENKKVNVIHRKRKLGLGSAYIMGFKWALEKKYDYIFEMDADFSHDPKDIPRFLKHIEKYDLVVGSRYKGGVSVVNWPIERLLLSYFANLFARIVTGVPVNDLTSGFKCYKRKVLESINFRNISSDGYGFQIETVFLAYEKRFKVYEIPIVFTDRVEGHSKMTKRIVWEAFWTVWRLRFRSRFKKWFLH